MNFQKKWLALVLCLSLVLSLVVSLVPRGAPVAGAINVLTDVPAFDWSYGCSATSAAMLFGYYDRTGYDNMYAGSTNGGVCPLNNSVWGHTNWPSITCGECPLSASHNGIDGMAIRGHVDDYWIDYQVTGPDPWVGSWTEHTLDCAGDYMGTNQEKYYNPDGGTTFFFRKDGDPLDDYTGQEPVQRDGCHGMKLFAESRGYTVSTNFNQKIQGQGTDLTKGFTFADFQTEIDAGRPVLIHVTGHTMLGYGYDTSASTIYIHDTWNYIEHTMTWGGTYDGRQHYGVTVIRLQPLQSCYLSISSTAGGSVTTPGEPGPFPYSPGTVVNLVATPDAGCHFVRWIGDVGTIADADDPTTTITMNGNYEIIAYFQYPAMVDAGNSHTVGLSSNGTPVAVGWNVSEQCDVGNWTGITQVSAGAEHTVGLRSDRTVIAVGYKGYGQCDVGNWTDVVQVSAGGESTVGLKSSGTVVATGLNQFGQNNVGNWTDIVQVAAGIYHTAGLTSNGAVVAVGWNTSGQCDVGSWTDIIQVAADWMRTVGLHSDGTVVAVGDNPGGQCDVGNWTDIVQVAAGGYHTVGLKADGTVVAVGSNYLGQCDVTSWTDIVQVTAGLDHTVGLKSDGTVVATGRNDEGQCDVTSWDLIP